MSNSYFFVDLFTFVSILKLSTLSLSFQESIFLNDVQIYRFTVFKNATLLYFQTDL